MVIFGEEQLDPVISGGGEIGLFIMDNHHPRYHVLPQGNREGIRIRHIKENAGVTQNHPHARRFRQNGALCKQLLFARVFLIDQHQNFLKEKRGSGSGFYRSLRRSEDLLCRLRHCGAVFGRNGKVIVEKNRTWIACRGSVALTILRAVTPSDNSGSVSQPDGMLQDPAHRGKALLPASDPNAVLLPPPKGCPPAWMPTERVSGGELLKVSFLWNCPSFLSVNGPAYLLCFHSRIMVQLLLKVLVYRTSRARRITIRIPMFFVGSSSL